MSQLMVTQTHSGSLSPAASLLQRQACSQCPDDAEVLPSKGRLRRAAIHASSPAAVPPIVHEVLHSPSHLLDDATRAFMEPRFGHDFSGVRVHTDVRATRSAVAVNAQAYTVGSDVVFGAGRYAPSTADGRALIAHELAHVVQGVARHDSPHEAGLTVDRQDSPIEYEAHRLGADALAGSSSARQFAPAMGPPVLSRAADDDARGYSLRLGNARRTGVQFSPVGVTDTRVGPVEARGAPVSARLSRLHVVIGENFNLRTLARQILPLWLTATPFTPPSGGGPLPLDIINADELAQALLVFNQFYLPVPAMTNWRTGFRLPLPVDIDEGTGVATVHPLQVRALAGAFQPAWTPLLDSRAAATTTPPAATLQADVAAFLARETTPLARGIHLGARALTNAVAERPFIDEVFRQLGPADSFDVALQFIDNLVAREVNLLAAQRDGSAILAAIRVALANAPAVPTPEQQAGLNRANVAFGGAAAIAAQPPPGAARTRPEKTITVDTLRLDGTTIDPATSVAVADAIFSQCNVHVVHGVNATATNAQTTAWLGGNTDLRAGTTCSAVTAEERNLFANAPATFGFGARFRAYFAASISGINASGYSCNPSSGPVALLRNTAVIDSSGDSATLAHELGHILINLGPHTRTGLMSARPPAPARRSPEVTDAHCTRLYNHA